MDRKDIIFDGVSNVPDDSLAQDGQLSLSVNAIKHGGSIQPVEKGTPERHDITYKKGTRIKIVRNERLEYIHHLPDTDEERYIVISSEIWVSDIALSQSELVLNEGEEYTLVPSFAPSDATNKSVTWSSSDEGIAFVDENGKVTAIREGNATITCKATDGSGVTATCIVTVIRPVTIIELKSVLTLAVGADYRLVPTIQPDDATSKELTWRSSDESVATVSRNGTVTAVSVGSCAVSCTPKYGEGVSAACAVHVVAPSTTVTLSEHYILLSANETHTLEAVVECVGETPSVTWTSSDTDVATVSADGIVTGIGIGRCTITATANDSSGAFDDCEVVVRNPITGITLSDTEKTLTEGDIYTIGAEITPWDATDMSIEWTSSDENIAVVDETGKVTAVKRGECIITCTAADGSGVSATCVIHVLEPATVDLGLPSGTIWATKNVGASYSADAGMYIAWGETEEKAAGKTYSWYDYELCNHTSTSITKYNDADGLTELEPEDDAATENIIGSLWQTPSRSQLYELVNKEYTTITRTQRDGVYGYLITSKTNGNSLFLPASGEKTETGLQGFGTYGKYWTRTLNFGSNTNIKDACVLHMAGNGGGMAHVLRYEGLCVRPVYIGDVPSGRPRKEETSTINTLFTITDNGGKMEFGGKLDEGRTLTLELTYNDGKKETVSVTFTKGSTYTLPTRYNTATRLLTNARVISYDDNNVTLNITWKVRNSPYYLGSIGTWAGFPIQDESEASQILDSELPTEIGEGGESEEEPIADSYSYGYYYGEIVSNEVYVGTPTSTKSGIAADGSPLHISWFNRKDGTRKEIAEISSPIREITSVKNVLIISTDAGLYFARNIGQGYQWLGQLPELPCVTPYLVREIKTGSTNAVAAGISNQIDLGTISIPSGERYIPATNLRTEIYNKVCGYYDYMISDAMREGKFSFPFLVRVAYRMFDGTYISVSRPYAMCPSTKYTADIIASDIKQRQAPEQTSYYFYFTIYLAACELALKIQGEVPEEWKDIITGYDVFVTEGVADYTKDDSGKSVDYLYFTGKEDIRYDSEIMDNISDSYTMYQDDLFKEEYLLDERTPEGIETGTITVEEVTLNSEGIDLAPFSPGTTGYVEFYVFDKQEVSVDNITATTTDTSHIDEFVWYWRNEEDYSPNGGLIQPWRMALEECVYRKALKKCLKNNGKNIDDCIVVTSRKSFLEDDGSDTSYYHSTGRIVDISKITASQEYAGLKITIPYAILLPEVYLRDTTTYTKQDGDTNVTVDYSLNETYTDGIGLLAIKQTDAGNVEVWFKYKDEEIFPALGDYPWLKEGDMFYDIIRAYYGNEAQDYLFLPKFLLMQGDRYDGRVHTAAGIHIVGDSVEVTRLWIEYNGGSGIVEDNFVNRQNIRGIIKMKRSTGTAVQEAFRNVGEFWKIHSKNFDELVNTKEYTLKLRDTDLLYLTSKPQLDNKVVNRYGFTCNDLYAYNNRLNVVIDNQELETPDYADNLYLGVDKKQTRQVANILYACEVVKDGVSRIVPVPKTGECVNYGDALRYFFYPNQNAIRLLEYIVDEDTIRSYSLTKHEGIYGSYAFNDWELLEPYETLTIADDSSDERKAAFNELARKIQEGYNKEFHVGNKILQSDVENPFAFLNSGVVQLGCETIHRICATARPISEGQKGKHDLYAFTDEGIYAIAVNNIGEYEKADLVSPEVITSDDVHQVEQDVLFASSKGLMSVSGNDPVCLSSTIEGHNHAEGLTAIEEVKDALGLEYVGSLGFHAKDWFTTAELVYDAKNGLIYLFQEPLPKNGVHDINLGLVYDVNEGVWGMYENKLLYGVNSYTDALAVQLTDWRGNGVLVNMSEPLNRHAETYKSLLVTRPMQFGDKDAYKTMEDIILRGAQGVENGMLVIWASNDIEHWKVIGSSQRYKWRNYSGTPYKYFRIGVLMNGWKEGDSITGISIDTTTRLTNKLR